MTPDPNKPTQDFSDRFPDHPGPIKPPSPKRNVGLWVGLGCLGFVLLSCCLLTFWVQAYGFRWILNQGDAFKAEASRIVLAIALEGTRQTCDNGAISKDAEQWFHPDTPEDVRNRACSIDEATLQQLGAPDRVPAEVLNQTALAEVAERFSMDPTLCYRYATDTLSVIGCFDPEGESGSIPYRIIDITQAQP